MLISWELRGFESGLWFLCRRAPGCAMVMVLLWPLVCAWHRAGVHPGLFKYCYPCTYNVHGYLTTDWRLCGGLTAMHGVVMVAPLCLFQLWVWFCSVLHWPLVSADTFKGELNLHHICGYIQRGVEPSLYRRDHHINSYADSSFADSSF